MTKTEHPQEKLWDLIKHIRFAMFTTRHANGHLHSRPMTTQNSKVDEDNRLWFFMSLSGDAAADIRQSANVNVGYSDTDKDAYVSVAGTASIVDDVAKKKALWSKMSEAWFPKGPEDPDLALVRVEIVHADYWDIKESKVTQLFKMAKAAMTGEPPQLGEHEQVRMS